MNIINEVLGVVFSLFGNLIGLVFDFFFNIFSAPLPYYDSNFYSNLGTWFQSPWGGAAAAILNLVDWGMVTYMWGVALVLIVAVLIYKFVKLAINFVTAIKTLITPF